MNLLMHVDQVSYVRFASVYKEFKDVDQLLNLCKASCKKRIIGVTINYV